MLLSCYSLEVDQHYYCIVVAAAVGAVTFDAAADLDYYCYAVVVVDQGDHDEGDFDEVVLMEEVVAWKDEDDRIVVAAVVAVDNLSVEDDLD